MNERCDNKSLRSDVRRLRRKNTTMWIIAAICFALALSQYYTSDKRATRIDQLQQRMTDKEGERQRAWQANAGLMSANAFLLNSVRWQSGVAGEKSGELETWKTRAEKAEQRWGGWKSRALDLEMKLCESQRTIDMYRGSKWSAEIPCEVSKK